MNFRGNAAALCYLAVLGIKLSVFSAPAYQEPFRPQFHFTPAKNWMNDPNGMVYFDGEYHLFYQYNPQGDKWGHMSWGHAVSDDMVHWEHLPVALTEQNDVMIFSGSAVVDSKNTSGFGEKGKTPLVAIYTGHHTAKLLQTQNLAYSLDRGRKWVKFSGNPVLDIGEKDFRDPKVFWYEGTKRWVMAVAWPAQRKVRFYASPDLKKWTHLSDFGPAGSTTGIWECPDLFPLKVEGSNEEKWVLIVNVGSGAPGGGSGTQYFIGRFDGSKFVLDRSYPKGQAEFVPEPSLLVDFEGQSYRGWQIAGDAFGTAPAGGTLEGQQPVQGFRGTALANSFLGGDKSQGSLTSKEFEISDDFLSFLIGGGNHPGKTCLNLVVGGTTVRTATGDNSEKLSWRSWDIREFRGKRAKLEIIDSESGGWGHVLVDHIVFADAPAKEPSPVALWADYGPDFYAAVTWNDVPKRDGRRLWLGWMSNWQYANDVPTSPWRSAMSLPRELTLRDTKEGARLFQEPIEELRKIRGQKYRLTKSTIAEANEWLKRKALSGDQWEIDAEFEPAQFKGDFGLRFLRASNQVTVVRCDTKTNIISLDRKLSGRVDFHPKFSGVYEAPLPTNAPVRLRIFIDTSSVEVFANDGRAVLTALALPRPATQPMEFWTSHRALTLRELNLWKLKPAVPIVVPK